MIRGSDTIDSPVWDHFRFNLFLFPCNLHFSIHLYLCLCAPCVYCSCSVSLLLSVCLSLSVSLSLLSYISSHSLDLNVKLCKNPEQDDHFSSEISFTVSYIYYCFISSWSFLCLPIATEYAYWFYGCTVWSINYIKWCLARLSSSGS